VIVAIGVDVCDVGRIRRALEASTGARFRARVFTLAEQAYCEARGRARFASYAARFAAKEAAMKALGTGWSAGVTWQDFEVVRAEGQAPRLVLHGRAAELAHQRRMIRWLVALSHERTGAVASVVVEDGPGVTATAGATAARRRRGAGGGSGRPRPRARR
jgi:holo-[acyl-carrier protein] synthase